MILIRVKEIRKSNVYFLVSLVSIYCILAFMNHFFPNFDTQLGGPVTPVTGSHNNPSFHPKAYCSESGRMHLFFSHEAQIYDFGSDNLYYCYELPTGDWSQPIKVIDDYSVSEFEIQSSEKGLIIYYMKGGISKKEFDEQENTWSEPLKLFGFSQITDYLNLTDNTTQYIYWGIYDFVLMENDSFFVAWGFYSRDPFVFNHEYADRCIISQWSPNGSCFSQPILGSKPSTFLKFVNGTTSLLLYDKNYFSYRTVLFPNGTWSPWHYSGFWDNSEFKSIMGKIYPSIVANRYGIYYHINYENNVTKWEMVELSQTNFTTKQLDLPHKFEPANPNGGIDLELISKNNLTPMFMVALITNQTIELWTLNYTIASWSQVSSLSYSVTESLEKHYIPLYSEFLDIDLIFDGSHWRVFWDQKVANKRLFEIFTVKYDPTTDEWSSVSQVTDTATITDDYSNGTNTSGFSYLLGVITLIIVLVFSKSKDKKF